MTAAVEPDDERKCEGLHSPVRPAPVVREGERLCRRCVGRTMSFLEDLAGDLLELELTVTRQAVVRMGGTPGTRHREHDDGDLDEAPSVVARELPLLFNERAARVRVDVEQRLAEWAGFVAGATGIDLAKPTPRRTDVDEPLRDQRPHPVRCRHEMVVGSCALCRGLPDPVDVLEEFVDGPRPPHTSTPRRRPGRVATSLAVLRDRRAKHWLRTDEQGPQLAEAVEYVRRRARGAVDRFDRRWYAGECGQPIEVVDLVDGEDGGLVPVVRQATCTADLYAEPGKAIVVCDGYREPDGRVGCGAIHPAVSRHKYVIRALRSRQLPLEVILSVVPQLFGLPAPPNSVLRVWRHRGRLRPLVCLAKHDDPAACAMCRRQLYDGGQVVDLVIAAARRQRATVCLTKHRGPGARRRCAVCKRHAAAREASVQP